MPIPTLKVPIQLQGLQYLLSLTYVIVTSEGHKEERWAY